MKWLVAVALITACSSKTSNGGGPATGPPVGSGSVGSGSVAGSGSGSASGSEPVIAKVCGGTCSGPLARIEVWRDAAGAIGRLVYDGDLERCSHPPRSYHDRDGAVTLTIPFEPIEPGSPKALEYQRTQKAQLDGLTKDSKEIWCREVLKSP